MKKVSRKKFKSHKNKFLFGSTSALITNLGLISGLYLSSNAKINIIGSILVIGLADNVSDTLGIHIYQEAEGLRAKEVWISSLTNFLSRMLFSLIFIIFFALFDIEAAAFCSMVSGLLLLAIISYFIAINKNANPQLAVIEHIGVAILVIIVSRFFSDWARNYY